VADPERARRTLPTAVQRGVPPGIRRKSRTFAAGGNTQFQRVERLPADLPALNIDRVAQHSERPC